MKYNYVRKNTSFKIFYQNFQKKIILSFFIFIIYYNKLNNLYTTFKIEKNIFIVKKKNDIIETKKYKKFENIKKKFYNDSFLKPFLNEITILCYIYHLKYKSLKYKTNIHISMSLNNNYIFPILVSVESIIINLNKMKTFITFHFLCSPDIKKKSLNQLKSLIFQSYNIEIIFYNMGKNFIKYKKQHYNSSAYYRLLIPIFIDVNRIIYLDGDTLTLKDLSEMYLTKFYGNYVLGFLDHSKSYLNKDKEIRSYKYINSGVLLLNLNKIRNNNKSYDLINFTINNTFLNKHDQTVINYALYPKIGRLPIKYGIWNFPNKLDMIKYSKKLKQKINITELEETMKDIGILHNVKCHPKIWYSKYKYTFIKVKGKRIKNLFKKFHNLWHFYAKKTFYYSKIKKKFNSI